MEMRQALAFPACVDASGFPTVMDSAMRLVGFEALAWLRVWGSLLVLASCRDLGVGRNRLKLAQRSEERLRSIAINKP